METELKPCPFCGGEADFETQVDEETGLAWEYAVCQQCFAQTDGCETKEHAEQAWNMRTGKGEHMTDLVDRNALLKVLIHRVKGNEDHFIVLGTNNTLSLMEEWVRSIPAVDAVEVVHGRLVETGWYEEYTTYGNCSVCGADNRMSNNYCGNCGAKMDQRNEGR